MLDAWYKSGPLADLAGLEGLGDAVITELIKFLRAADKTKKETVWDGGGGFRTLDVAPSMFAESHGQIFLSDWATNGQLAEATAAQLRYQYEFDAPFCGRRGRSRLAVIDGLVSEDVVRLLVAALPDDERVVIAGTAVDPASRTVLRKLRPGSTVRKIPQSILHDYRQTTRVTSPGRRVVANLQHSAAEAVHS